MFRKALLHIAIAGFSVAAFAQRPPTSGSQIQQIPPAPVQQQEFPGVRIEPGTPPPPGPLADEARIQVKSLRVTGQTRFAEAELVALTGFTPGSELTLTELRGMASRIADHFHRNGYFVAQAYLPPQAIEDGAVTITVMEGRYGNILLNNQSNLSSDLARGLLDGLKSGDPITIGPLENRLLLLSDIPGVNVRSTLIPGASVGASDLIVEVAPGQRVTGSIDADNAGNRYTGPYRLGGTVNLNNLAGRGDVFSLRAVTGGEGLNYGRASYQMQFGKATAGIAYSALRYRLGEEFESLRAHGTAEIASVYGNYPLIRSRNTNLYVLGGYDFKTFRDEVDVVASVVDRRAQVGFLGLYGNHRDGFGGGGVNTYALTVSSGEIDIRTPVARALDAATVGSNGRFEKIAFTAARLQHVTANVSLYAAVTGQLASKNLDISEKMALGGAYAVRAYPTGESYADEAYVLNLEARWLAPRLFEGQTGQIHLIAFVDTGTAIFNKDPWIAGPNRRTLSGAGFGATWTDYNNVVVRAFYAFKLGNAVATSAPDEDGRFWIQAVKFF